MSSDLTMISPMAPRSMAGSSARRFWRIATTGLASAVIGAASASCVSAAPYNPQNLDGAQLSRIVDICRTTMGLSPSEPPSVVWGAAQDPHLDPGENHYQGCIASLSESLSGVNQGQAMAQADAACRTRGYREGTPDLAECVLGARESQAGRSKPVYGRLEATSMSRQQAGPFYRARGSEVARRERDACAQLGLNPIGAAFDRCVSNMDETFYRIDNPQN